MKFYIASSKNVRTRKKQRQLLSFCSILRLIYRLRSHIYWTRTPHPLFGWKSTCARNRLFIFVSLQSHWLCNRLDFGQIHREVSELPPNFDDSFDFDVYMLDHVLDLDINVHAGNLDILGVYILRNDWDCAQHLNLNLKYWRAPIVLHSNRTWNVRCRGVNFSLGRPLLLGVNLLLFGPHDVLSRSCLLLPLNPLKNIK